MGLTSSSVVPGYVVDSSTMSWPGRILGTMARAVAWMKELSGSRWRPSGVGTQMRIASQSRRRSRSVVAVKRPLLAAAATRSGPMCLIGDLPCEIASTFFASTSNPVTVNPASWKTSASGRPTYPWPITPTWAERLWILSRRSLVAMRRPRLSDPGAAPTRLREPEAV